MPIWPILVASSTNDWWPHKMNIEEEDLLFLTAGVSFWSSPLFSAMQRLAVSAVSGGLRFSIPKNNFSTPKSFSHLQWSQHRLVLFSKTASIPQISRRKIATSNPNSVPPAPVVPSPPPVIEAPVTVELHGNKMDISNALFEASSAQVANSSAGITSILDWWQPVAWMTQLLENVHSFTGLPWWSAIIVHAFLLRKSIKDRGYMKLTVILSKVPSCFLVTLSAYVQVPKWQYEYPFDASIPARVLIVFLLRFLRKLSRSSSGFRNRCRVKRCWLGSGRASSSRRHRWRRCTTATTSRCGRWVCRRCSLRHSSYVRLCFVFVVWLWLTFSYRLRCFWRFVVWLNRIPRYPT